MRALENQIMESESNTCRLKRARNSLLNINRVPPEVLGQIFTWTLARNREYSTLCEDLVFYYPGRDYQNILLVCNHWFQVACSTPELWRFWGSTVPDWRNRHGWAGAAPTDLLLIAKQTGGENDLCDTLRNALRNRTAQDRIREVHLNEDALPGDANQMGSILSLLTPSGNMATQKSLESISLRATALPDLSGFFVRLRLPRLRHLALSGALPTPVWDNLTPLTNSLTALTLQLSGTPPTFSQLLSVLVSNSNLQNLHLVWDALPDEEEGIEVRVSLPSLRTIDLFGEFEGAFGLLLRLELPATLERIDVRGRSRGGPTAGEILPILGLQLQDRFRYDPQFQDSLAVSIRLRPQIDILVRPATDHPGGTDLEKGLPYIRFTIVLTQPKPEKFPLDLMEFFPREKVVYLEAMEWSGLPEELLTSMPNLQALRFRGHPLREGFLLPKPDRLNADRKFLPSLRLLRLRQEKSVGGWDCYEGGWRSQEIGWG
jgi:hypothetical protein